MLCGVSEAQKLAPRPNQVQTVSSKLAILTITRRHGLYKLHEQYPYEVHRPKFPCAGTCSIRMPITVSSALGSFCDKRQQAWPFSMGRGAEGSLTMLSFSA